MQKLQTHYTHSTTKKKIGSTEGTTEQHHAEGLKISNMVKSGFSFSNATPVYADVSEIPDLSTMLNNRRRLDNMFQELKPLVKAKIGTVDQMVRLLQESDEKTLMDIGLIKQSEEYQTKIRAEHLAKFKEDFPEEFELRQQDINDETPPP